MSFSADRRRSSDDVVNCNTVPGVWPGQWLGLVPASVMRFRSKEMHLKVLPIKTVSAPAPVGFITVKDRTLTPLAERFTACARDVAKFESGRA
jgi:hypothetical protein